MSTQSTISITDGKLTKTIYCNWDGYLSNNGNTLLNHYKTKKKVNELIDLGSISALRENVKPTKNPKVAKKDNDGRIIYDKKSSGWKPKLIKATEPHSFDNPHEGVVIAYGRDRGDFDDIRLSIGTKPKRDYYEEFDYLFKRGVWYVRTNKNFVKLTQRMCDTENK